MSDLLKDRLSLQSIPTVKSHFICAYSARGRLGVICLLACSSSWSVQRKDLTLSERKDKSMTELTGNLYMFY